MGIFSRFSDIVNANINAVLEKAEDPEKLLRALIREMEDASEEARMASAELLAEQQHLERLESQLSDEVAQWQRRAENAVTEMPISLADCSRFCAVTITSSSTCAWAWLMRVEPTAKAVATAVEMSVRFISSSNRNFCLYFSGW